ncbi:class I SAM-dependent methyltransferase [Desulfonatronovibrio hydrogenovorans]|uniref:class I SAM-dependent methyltransferase n=1 Tax=Desulfonatronovibrio hydrogenovorans TaxID=53245 RepID=UPI0004915929|nr:class I SAM-dependent methyltransferase [Desulfonatronovibrio hydrogenovorans]
MNSYQPNGFEKRWQKIFQAFAQKHEHDAGIAGWSVTGLRARQNHFEHYFSRGGKRSGKWLDAGCGAGNYSRLLAENGLSVTGLDYSCPSLAKARLRSQQAINWIAGDVKLVPFEDRVFSGVVCFGVSQALSGSDLFLNELTRVAVKDSELWVDGLNKWCVVHFFSSLWRRIKRKPRHLRYECPYSMRKKLKLLGWNRVDILWLPILPARLHRIQNVLEIPVVRNFWQKAPLVGLMSSHGFVLRAKKN